MTSPQVHYGTKDHQEEPAAEKADQQTQEPAHQGARQMLFSDQCPDNRPQQKTYPDGNRLKDVVFEANVRPHCQIAYHIVGLAVGQMSPFLRTPIVGF